MKNNLKKKVMLAVLAGGMLCANGAFAATNYFYDTSSNQWKTGASSTAASGLTLTVDDSTKIGGNDFASLVKNDVIYVGYSSGNTVYNNTITFDTTDASTINADIYGGYSGTDVAGGTSTGSANKVIINGGTFSGSISGGRSNSGSAKGNTVTINGGTFSGSIYGGNSNSGSAEGNIVTINGGTFSGSIYGGKGLSATDSIVVINGGTFKDGFALCGGNGSISTGNALTLWTVIGGKAKEVTKFQKMNFAIPKGMDTEMPMLKVETPVLLSGVTVGIRPNDLSLSPGDYITLIKNVNDDEFVLTDNLAILNFTSYKELVYGDCPLAKGDYTIKQGENKWSASAANGTYSSDTKGNTTDGGLSATNYSGNEIIIRRGTYSGDIYGANSNSGSSVTGNKVSIYDGKFDGTSTYYIRGGYSGSGDATENTVIINGGTFGGTSWYYICGGNSGSGKAENNTVTINGGTFNEGLCLSGGEAPSGTSSGNILNLNTKIGRTVEQVAYFQIMNFTLPAGIQDGDTMLSTNALAVSGSGGTATVNVKAADGVKLNKGDVITLVNPSVKYGNYTAGDILGGAAEFYFEAAGGGEDKNGDSDRNDLVIVLTKDFEQKSGGGADQQKAPAEGVAAAAAMVNVSADLASGEGMDSMLAETAGGETNTFGAVSAGRSKFKTGSHVDVDGWGVVVGAGKTKEWTNGSATTMGIFLEYGKGDFDTYNGVFHGDGDTKNHGVGVMARHKATNNNYYEGNIRYGRQETSWGQSEIGGYETDSRYYGVMVGMGHIIQLGKNELDVYGRYSYGHVGACNAKVGNNDYRFDSVKSHRVRVGGKYNFVRANSKAKPFVGVAWEHEFNGESKATIAGVGQAPAPGLKGNTGIIQAGCDWDLGKKWSAGAGVNAYVGKRKGWDGMLRAFYSF